MLSPLTRVSSDDESFNSASNRGLRKRRVSSIGDEEEVDAKRQMKPSSLNFHRTFVEAVYEVGLKHASPSVILENMKRNSGCVTSERVKSHLQKYRQNRIKGKDEFLESYDEWMTQRLESTKNKNEISSHEALLETMCENSLSSGNLAAFLSFSVMLDDNTSPPVGEEEVINVDLWDVKTPADYLKCLGAGAILPFPELTEEEKCTSIGEAMLYVQNMFTLMTSQLEIMRGQTRRVSIDQPIQGNHKVSTQHQFNEDNHRGLLGPYINPAQLLGKHPSGYLSPNTTVPINPTTQNFDHSRTASSSIPVSPAESPSTVKESTCVSELPPYEYRPTYGQANTRYLHMDSNYTPHLSHHHYTGYGATASATSTSNLPDSVVGMQNARHVSH